MKFIIPIGGLANEVILKLGNIEILPPHFYGLYYEEGVVTEEDFQKYKEIFDICEDEYLSGYNNYAVAVFEHDFTREEFQNNIVINEFVFLEEICFKVDRALDYLRVEYCSFLNRAMLPDIPGIIEGYRKGIVIDTERKISRQLLGDVFQFYSKPGIGLQIDYIDGGLYEYFFLSNRDDEIYTVCRNAFTRLSEAMYMNSANTSFVYLMSTIEMLADKEYIKFTKAKTNILAFIATSKKEYLEKLEWFKEVSKVIRTEVVHNGKSIYEILHGEQEVERLLNRLMSIIVVYCGNVLETEITSFDELTIERAKRIKQLT